MNRPPYELVYQDDRWAVVDMTASVKKDHYMANVKPSYPWIMHYCATSWNNKNWWNFASDLKTNSLSRCRGCHEKTPDKILTIHELYR